VIIDIEDLDTDPPSKPFQGSRFEVSETAMAEWMRDIIVGLSLGESKEGKSHADRNESEEVKAEYTEKKVRITLHKIETPKLPPADDELAKKVGVQTKEEMLRRLRENMEKQLLIREQNLNRERLADALLEEVHFDIPASVLKTEIDYRMKQRLQDRLAQNRWKNLSKEDQEKELDVLKGESEKAIRMYYICRKITYDNKIRISPEEIYPKVETTLDAMFADPAALNHEQKSKEQEVMLFSRLMLSKAQDFMIEKILSGQ
jgi:trigger factor